jgi:SAM-dependent methyltransferase
MRGMSRPEVTRHYVGDKGRQYHEDKRGIPETAFLWVARLRADKIARYVRETNVVFEFGVGSGWNLAELKCREKIGCDVSQFLAAKVRALGIEFVSDPKWVSEFSVDVAICHHVLEHVLHPPEVLYELRRKLCVNGKLLLFVPFEKEARYRRFEPAEPNHHLYSWNAQTLGNLVEESGFKVVEAGIGRFGYDRFAAAWAEKLRVGESGFRALRSLLHLVKPASEVRIVARKK